MNWRMISKLLTAVVFTVTISATVACGANSDREYFDQVIEDDLLGSLFNFDCHPGRQSSPLSDEAYIEADKSHRELFSEFAARIQRGSPLYFVWQEVASSLLKASRLVSQAQTARQWDQTPRVACEEHIEEAIREITDAINASDALFDQDGRLHDTASP